MFNKRDVPESEQKSGPAPESRAAAEPPPARSASGAGSNAAIGPSIQIDGELKGNEDLVIEGQVNGTVKLNNNTLTIGAKGKVTADVYANSISVQGQMKGDLYAAERITIHKTAQIQGNIFAPRVSLEEGARFKGSIEMDPEADALKRAFRQKQEAASGPRPATGGKSESAAEVGSRSPGSGEESKPAQAAVASKTG